SDFSLQCTIHHPHLHSFPTRRSSDLTALFKRLKTTNKINVQTIRGRNGGVILALVKNILVNQIKNHHKQAKKALQEYLGINLDTLKNVKQSKNDYQEITLDTG